MLHSKTTMVGLFGRPVGHSLSPVMHNTAFEQKQLPFAYAAFEVNDDQIKEAVEAIRALGMRGANVTIPHKVAVIPYLDKIDPLAERIGAVNTIVNEDGTLIGYNTDGTGYVRSLLEETGIDLTEQTVTLLGAGGAARAVACTLVERGVKEIRIVNRSLERAELLALALGSQIPIRVYSFAQAELAIQDSTLLINTTSIGMYPHIHEMPVDRKCLRPDLIVSDLIYNPLETQLLQCAKEIGATHHSGLGMFINQGALAYELWTGEAAPTDKMREIVLQHLQQGGN
ncbi:shikimate dehydrogenase [Brevibacillus halotolerans]|uniref:shikimate dehydrogenase n=2 Tax=Brevibacillus laterosporus TaxID=1465 RepID=UPI0009F58C6B|nr:shikimate dehydrogenase [Brevibacillus laterosporus]AYK07222.1 shikimate dehydrogenase [Brevibacillus laterosporus]PCN44541.1 shikimate dehydrogenase [Brevibacillus laterosporus]WPS90097.1 shikimate dehydrogenase [Brevibacillus halotolerans]